MNKAGLAVSQDLPFARRMCEIADKRRDAYIEVVDVAKYNLPLFDEPMGGAG
jgi:hypothetical protein